MTGSLFPVLLAASCAFVAAFFWYALFGAAAADAPGYALLVEFTRTALVAAVLARLVVLLRAGAKDAARLGLLLWLGFPAMLLLGSVLWEGVPWRLAAIHAGDWLAKLCLMGAILGAWRARQGDLR